MIAVVWPQVCRDLLDPFRDAFGWLRSSEPWGFVFADEGCFVLMIVREQKKPAIVIGADVVE